MDMGLARFLVVSMLKNRNMLFWGVAFMLMWILVGAFVFTSDFPKLPQPYMDEAVRLYTADWASFVIVYEPSGVLIGLLYTLIYQTAGITYLRKYGRLTPTRFIASYYLGMIAPSLISSLVLIASIVLLFYAGFRYHGFNIPILAVLPKDPILGTAEVVGLAILVSLFMEAILFLLGIAALNVSLRQVSRLSFIPYILTFISYFIYLYLNVPKWVILLDPFMGFMGIIVTVYSGFSNIPSYLVVNAVHNGLEIGKAVPLTYGIVSAVIWTIIPTILAIPLVMRIKYKPPEEVREF